VQLLRVLGGPDAAVITGITLGVAEQQGIVVLDGMLTSVAALLACAVEPAVSAHLVAGQRSREQGHPIVLRRLGLEPLLDLRLRAGEGVGAALATHLLLDACRMRRSTAVVDAVPVVPSTS
jgi:nicotinate-nucleotide--dimethylbenzimidazole phosphoribosyltransferase